MLPLVTLKVIEGPHAGKELTCTDRLLITIGRAPECNFALTGPDADQIVSRRHCLIDVRPDCVEIRDLESRNGTYVNGVRLGFPLSGKPEGSLAFRRRLKDGDHISVGTSVFQVTIRQTADNAMPGDEEVFPLLPAEEEQLALVSDAQERSSRLNAITA
jgi:pSer/pThr/pTyr-binding forkhead associated (FHA) protein